MPISPARVFVGVAGAVAAFAAAFGASAVVMRRHGGSLLPARRAAPVAEASAPGNGPLALAADASVDAQPDEPTAPPSLGGRTFNVVLITVDTLRIDLGFMGYDKPVTANLDQLASRAAVFERAYSLASYTSKSVGPTLIGKYASETQRDFEHFTTYYNANTFLAERLHAAGVRTIGGMCHYYFRWKTGYDQGFDVWDTSAIPPGMSDGDGTVTSDLLSDLAIKLLEDPLPKRAAVDAGVRADADAGPGADAGPDGPGRFFAWFHYFDPHAKYVPHPGSPKFGHDLRALYDEEIWFTDKHIGRVLDHIAAQPWAADTAIIVTADHGEAFGEHGMRTHGREVWEPLVRVPLVVYIPGFEGRRVPIKRSLIDLAPTVLELMGVPGDDELRGTSLVSDALGDELEERDVYIDMPEGPYNDPRFAIITGQTPGQKLIALPHDHYQLYDLRDDPDEKKNLARDKEQLAPVLARYQSFRSGLKEIRVTGPRKDL